MSDSSATTDTDTAEINPFRKSPLSDKTDELQVRFRDQAEWYRLNAVRKLTPSDLELRRRRVNKEYAALGYLNCNARKLKADALRQDGEKRV